MGEVVTGPFSPDPRRQAAEEHQQRSAAALRSEAEQIRQRLAACRKVPKEDRQKFAVHCYRMFQKLDALENGDVGAILREVTGERGDPSKRRGRFAQLTKLDTPLTARGSQWEKLVRLASKRLGTQDREIIEMVAGTSFSERTDGPLLADIGQTAAEIAGTLQLMAHYIARRHGLADYFEALRYCPYVLSNDRVRIPDAIPQAANMDHLADGLWIHGGEDESELAFLPKVPLFHQHAWIPCMATAGTVSADHVAQDNEDMRQQFQAIADYEGVTQARFALTRRISIAIAPLGQDRSPSACFVIEPRLAAWIDGHSIDVFGATPGEWFPVPHEDRCYGFSADAWNVDLVPDADHLDCYRLEVVGRENTLNLMRSHMYGEGLDPLIWGFDAEATDRNEPLAPTAAPGLTMMGVLQRNLTAVAEEHRIQNLLDADAARLTRLLADAQAEDRERYRRALQPLIDRWKELTEINR